MWENSPAPFIIQGSVRDICFPDYFSSEVERRGDGEGEPRRQRERERARGLLLLVLWLDSNNI